MTYSLHQQKEWLRALYVNSPGDQAHFDQQYQAAIDIASRLRLKSGTQTLSDLLDDFDGILSGEQARHSTPGEKNFLMMRSLYLLMISSREVLEHDIQPPGRELPPPTR